MCSRLTGLPLAFVTPVSKNHFFIILTVLTLSHSAFSARTCESLFSGKNLELTSSVLPPNVKLISQIHKSILEMKTESDNRISQEQYNDVNALLRNIKRLSLPGKENLKSILAQQNLSLESRAQKFRSQADYRKFLDANYTYFHTLNEINQNLNFKVFPNFGLKEVKSNEQTIEIGKRIVADLAKKYENHFADLGHKNLEAFRAYAKAYSPNAEWVINQLKDHAVVALHVPEGVRSWVPITGFQNQRATGTSGGSLFYDFSPRNRTESGLMQLDYQAYNQMSVRAMPKYAELRYDFTKVPDEPHDQARIYGNDLWMIKKEVLAERASLTPFDSLNEDNSLLKSPVTKSFIPWSYRELLTAFLTHPTEKNVLSKSSPRGNEKPEDFLLSSKWGEFRSYVEVQIFGSLTLDDVSALHFKKNPPNKEFYKLLKSKNIEVYDERQWPPVKWEPKN